MRSATPPSGTTTWYWPAPSARVSSRYPQASRALYAQGWRSDVPPGRTELYTLAKSYSSRVWPMIFSTRVSIEPAAPTNGSPKMPSSNPGASPTSRIFGRDGRRRLGTKPIGMSPSGQRPQHPPVGLGYLGGALEKRDGFTRA